MSDFSNLAVRRPERLEVPRTATATVLLFTLFLCGAASEAKERAGGGKVSPLTDSAETAIGREADKHVREDMGLYAERAELTAYVQQVGDKVASRSERPKLDFHFAIVDSPEMNAFALPGGYVYVTRGMLARLSSEDELALVLGHEVAHIAARHGAAGIVGAASPTDDDPAAATQRAAAVALNLAFEGFQQAEEREADDLAAKYAKKAGYDPRAAIEVAKTLARVKTAEPSLLEVFLASHPEASDKVAKRESQPRASEGGSGAAGDKTPKRDPYLKKIEGIRVGWWSPAGYQSGSRYLNLRQDYAITIPDGWSVHPGADVLLMTRPRDRYRAEVTVQTNTRPGASAESALDYARKAPQLGFEIAKPVGRATLPAGEAAVVTMRGRDERSGSLSIRKMFLARFDKIYLVTFVVPEDKADETMDTFMKMTGTLRFLEPAEITNPPLEPRIALYTAKAGDTWSSIAASQSGSESRAGTLATWNGREAGDTVPAGTLVKIPPASVFE